MPSFSVESLEADIRHHQKLYDKGEPEISDATFDELVEMLRRKSPSSPVLNELGKARSGKKIKHSRPMLSLEKCYDEKKLRSWLAVTGGPWIVQPKFDGLALSLIYRDGKLVSAATRGDGEEGDDVTAAARMFVPTVLNNPLRGEIEVRGEALLLRKVFEEKYAGEYANARNLVAGMVQRHTPDPALRDVHFVAYDLLGSIFATQSGKRVWLSPFFLGNRPVDGVRFEDRQGLIDFVTANPLAGGLPYEADGLVIKIDDVQKQEKLGATAHHPRWALAWKFQGESGRTKLLDVEWEVSRTGTITPVAVMGPVELSGVTITRATLHNLRRLRELDLHRGYTLLVTRRGGVIPHVEAVVSETGRAAHSLCMPPTHCPGCGNSVSTYAVDVLCNNPHTCRGVARERVLYWCRTTGMLGWGPEIVAQVMQGGLDTKPLVKTLPDLYRLDAAKLGALVGEKTAAKLIAEVDKTRELPSEVFLAGLGIDGLGLETAKKVLHTVMWDALVERHNDLAAKLSSVTGIGQKKADAIIKGLKQYEDLIDVLCEYVKLKSEDETTTRTGPFAGHKVVFTGALSSMERSAAQELVRQAGGETPASLTKETTILVVGDGAKSEQTSKRDKALKYGTEVIDETEFARRLAEC